MTKYQLAKLVLMAGGLPSRKRIQKTVHLLQAAGCPLEADFRLHYYGPYSSEVAALLDEMTTDRILIETAHPFEQGTRYDYEFNPKFLGSLEEFERTAQGSRDKAELETYAKDLALLKSIDVKTLELAATMGLYRQSGRQWSEALQETCDFKRESPGSEQMRRAEELARRMVRAHYEQDRENLS